MAYLQSPGVQILEKDASAVVVGASSTVGGTVGVFQWGPVATPMLISNEANLVSIFGTPDTNTYASFFSASTYLSYATSLWVTRAATVNKNATADGTGLLIKNVNDYESSYSAGQGAVGNFAARYPGTLGNGIVVSIADSNTFGTWDYKTQFTAAPGTSEYVAGKGGSNDELHVIVIDLLGKFSGTPGATLEKYAFVSKAGDALSFQGLANHYATVIRNQSQYVYWMDHPASGTNWGNNAALTAFTSLSPISVTLTAATNNGTVATGTFAAQTVAPFVVGSSITVSGVTPAGYNTTATVIACTTTTVQYAISGTFGAGTIFGTATGSASYLLSGAIDQNTPSDAELQLGWDIYKDVETYDISLFFTGNANAVLSKYVVDNIAEIRKDAVVFISMCTPAGGPIFSTSATIETDATTFKTAIGNSTYTVIDSGYKYMYDKYNDKYRWIALNADIAGLCAKVDSNQDTWFSPAGLTKGQIRGAIKLALNPNQAQRDILYKLAINPVVSMVGQGTLLYGDKTATLKPSSFDRINVRRLFLALEKSIARASKYQLFELNDAITRAQFVASVEPFLRDVQGRRGIEAFLVVCDATNNTDQVIATNEFRASILVKPLYSINTITLSFVSVGGGVTFSTATTV